MKKILYGIFTIILFFICSNVYAKVDDTLFISRRYSDVFAIQEYKTGGHRMYNGLIYYMTKGSKTEIGYCIELGAPLEAVTYSSTDDYSRFGLSKKQADYIKLVSYYGYDYGDHKDRFYYFAAQEIIWEYLTGDEIYYVDEEDYNASRINIDSYKRDIINLVNRHYIAPKFSNVEFSYGDSFELVDSNGILSEYNVISVTNANYSVSGNKITLTSTSMDDIEITLARKINGTNSELFYYASGSQSIVSTGIVDNNLVRYSFSNSGVNLKLNKKDYDTGEYITDSKVGFRLFDIDNNRYIGDTYNVNNEGYVVIPNIKKGNYKVEEVDLGIDNYLYNDEGLEFSVNGNNIVYDNGYVYNVDFYNKKPKGKIQVNKTGEEFVVDNNSYSYNEISLSDVIFDVITMQDVIYGEFEFLEGEVIDSIKTDSNGIAIIDNLPLGKYKIIEKEVDSNYELDNQEYIIDLDYIDCYTSVINYNINIKNYLKKAKLEIIKVDDDGNYLDGVLFNVLDNNNNIIYEGVTNKEGRIILDDLIFGNYIVYELKGLDGYIMDNYRYYVNFNDNNREERLIIKNNKIMPPKTSNKRYNFIMSIMVFYLSLCVIRFRNML